MDGMRSKLYPFRFKNVNGSCLIDCTLNSILNSHEITVKLYELTSSDTSLNDDFIELLNINKSSIKHQIFINYYFLLSFMTHLLTKNNHLISSDT